MLSICGIILILSAVINSADYRQWRFLCETELVKTCYYSTITNDLPYLDERQMAFPRETIFFIETSCRKGLDVRQECSIEAAAKAHPDRKIIVLFAGPVLNRRVLDYKNVDMYRLNISRIYQKTPLDTLKKRQFRCLVHRWPDVLRFLILYRYSGIYLDLNVIVAKSFDQLTENDNWVGQIDANFVGSGVLAFSTDDPSGIGHIVVNKVLRFYKKYFLEKKFNRSGIDILTRVMKRVCKTYSVSHMTARKCDGLEVFDSTYFYPVHYKSWKNYYEYRREKLPTEPYAFYIWNYLTHNETLYHESIYGRLVHAGCPRNREIFYQLNHLLLKNMLKIVPLVDGVGPRRNRVNSPIAEYT